MGDHQNGLRIFLRRFFQKAYDFAAVFRIQIAGRFIRQNQRRAGKESPSDGHALLLTAGELTRKMAAPFLKPKNMQKFIQILFIGSAGIQKHREHDILFYVQLRDQMERLEYKTDIAATENRQFFVVQ